MVRLAGDGETAHGTESGGYRNPRSQVLGQVADGTSQENMNIRPGSSELNVLFMPCTRARIATISRYIRALMVAINHRKVVSVGLLGWMEAWMDGSMDGWMTVGQSVGCMNA